ncbi:hypothetical protein, partial [Corynebacterium pseudodiphtheriticum]|uniref:hypothetical protein n=1 Tax=Corynebacterium pseudodiphtheriticum TaxID=37637 RepID=UPI00254DD1BF
MHNTLVDAPAGHTFGDADEILEDFSHNPSLRPGLRCEKEKSRGTDLGTMSRDLILAEDVVSDSMTSFRSVSRHPS